MEEHRVEYTEQDIKSLNSNKGLHALLSQEKSYDLKKAIRHAESEKSIKKLQVELIKLQTWVINNNEKVVVIFEGRDAAGKGGAIRRIIERLNPRHLRVVALPKPTKDEQSQWYFQRYVNVLPTGGEIVFFDRSWYNRAVVEPVNGFCRQSQYERFMHQVNNFESMIVESGVRLVKIYMSISRREQAKRFREIKANPLKVWKMSKVDENAQRLWDEYTKYKDIMFANAKEGKLPFKVIKANRKTSARVDVIKHILETIPFDADIEV
ncbi:MAG TPA: polyphosphate kinase 2 [Lutibacter sp.]|nr:polyphosphate kinase 2 [Lutibacter sp.]